MGSATNEPAIRPGNEDVIPIRCHVDIATGGPDIIHLKTIEEDRITRHLLSHRQAGYVDHLIPLVGDDFGRTPEVGILPDDDSRTFASSILNACEVDFLQSVVPAHLVPLHATAGESFVECHRADVCIYVNAGGLFQERVKPLLARPLVKTAAGARGPNQFDGKGGSSQVALSEVLQVFELLKQVEVAALECLRNPVWIAIGQEAEL
jgi:hypothetical protein